MAEQDSTQSALESKRTIGVSGLIVTLVGFVIGISIYILPGALAASAGPAVVLSYAIAGLLALFSCVVAAQVGAVFPVSGAGFLSISRLVSPFWGFTAVWLMIGGASIAMALLAFGFADYAVVIWPEGNRLLMAVTLVVVLTLLNLSGVKDTVRGQAIMVAVFLSALAVFGAYGVSAIKIENLTPFIPNGLSPVVLAAIPAFFSFAGFASVIEIGGEIKDPARTIPVGLFWSFTIVLVVYLCIATILVGIIPWQDLGDISAPLSEASSRIMPSWLATTITLTAVAAAASSVNVLLLSFSRDVQVLAVAKVFPSVFARTSTKHGEPVYAIIFLATFALVGIASGGNISAVATLIAMALLSMQIGLGIVVLRIPTQMSEQYQASAFRLSKPLLTFFGGGLILLSGAFMVLTIQDDPNIATIAGTYIGTGWLYYLVRKRALTNQGINIDQEIEKACASH